MPLTNFAMKNPIVSSSGWGPTGGPNLCTFWQSASDRQLLKQTDKQFRSINQFILRHQPLSFYCPRYLKLSTNKGECSLEPCNDLILTIHQKNNSFEPNIKFWDWSFEKKDLSRNLRYQIRHRFFFILYFYDHREQKWHQMLLYCSTKST